MELKCFTFVDNLVEGPFSKEELNHYLESHENAKQIQVWWKGQKHWSFPKAFLLHEPEENVFDIRKSKAIWFVEKEGKVQGPLIRDEMLQALKDSKNLSQVKIWQKGQKSKATVYQHNDLQDSLGIVQRKSSRAPIVGEVEIKKEKETIHSKITSISMGGLGVADTPDLVQGEILDLRVTSPLLTMEFSCKGQVRYNSNTRTGIEFDTINAEAKASIMEYVKQFSIDEKKKVA
ncbi:MAG: PilZ domain-containing protein [Bdellovibrionales bacterium]